MKLHLAETLALPVDLATQTLLVVGKRGTGKSNTCVRLAEQLYRASIPFVALDPSDSWWGLKASGDGKGPGLEVYVFGGKHADLPLEPTSGALMADLFIERRISGVLAIRHFSGRERARFVTAFCERLLERNSEPLHVFLEEAHEVAPQVPGHGEEEMLGAVKKLWTRGRAAGLSGSAITQRPASLSKTITTQSEILIVHRILGPQDVAAIREWIKYHGEREEILGQLSTLKAGEAFVWAPDFPESKPIGLVRVKILRRETFDSGATPKAGERRAEPKHLAPVDLDALRGAMAATIEKAKAEDPKALQARIRALEAELARERAMPALPAERVEVPVLAADDLQRIENLVASAREASDQVVRSIESLCERAAKDLQAAAGELGRVLSPLLQPSRPPAASPPARSVSVPRAARTSAPMRASGDDAALGSGERAVLIAIAQHEGGVSREQLSVLTGYKRSTRDSYLQRLGARGLVDVSGTAIAATAEGRAALGPDFEPLPTGEALRAYWLDRLPEGERRVLEVVIDVYPRAASRDMITNATDYKRSTRDSYLQRLGSRKLVEALARGEVRASETLF